MIRIATLAALAVAIAAPASAESLRVSTLGKSPEQLHSDIVKAARMVCTLAEPSSYFVESRASCIKETVADAVAQVGDPSLVAVASTSLK